MFVVADVLARFKCVQSSNRETNLLFPVASHYSGNTAQSTASLIKGFLDGVRSDDCINAFNLYKRIYKVPVNVIRRFVSSDYLMSYFNEEIIWELQSLDVSCDFSDAYTTSDSFFDDYVKAIFRQYSAFGLLIKNRADQLAINYDDSTWREETKALIDNTDIRHISHRNTILSALNNLSGDWEWLRKTGYGVKYNLDGEEWIIDPMFDSELFMVFDLFVYWKNHLNTPIIDSALFFDTLFSVLKDKKYTRECSISSEERVLISHIIDCLPCSVFVAEEHLKNWIGKKFFAEQKLLHPDFRTLSYRILGMALLDGKRMSASRGHAVLSRDLIKEYGGTITRLVLLMSGGNISKTYNYESTLPLTAKSILDRFSDYLVFLKSNYEGGTQCIDISFYTERIQSYVEDGYLRQAIIELLVNIPSEHKDLTFEGRCELLSFYKKYLRIFIPDYANCYC